MSTVAIPSSPVAALRKSSVSGVFAWPVWTVLLVTGLYLPTLNTRFDFIDDGNLVYPAAPMPLGERLQLVWAKIEANFRDLGPFRPVLWAHWELQAELFQGDELSWRLCRLVWTGWATAMMLWLLRLLGIRPLAAAVTTALAMWNPWRGEVWTSLTLAEGVAMPYAILTLVCAIKAARSNRSWFWDMAGILCMLAALGCKNTFAAMIPAQMFLRLGWEGESLRQAWRQHGRRACLLAVTLLVPLTHFVIFKVNRREGNYDPGLFSWEQLRLMVGGVKGALNIDLIGVGLAFSVIAVTAARQWRTVWDDYRSACVAGLLILVCGVAIYLPMQGLAGRYAMPAAWGGDLLIAALLSTLSALAWSAWKPLAYVGLAVGLLVLAVVNVVRQDKFAARADVLWQTLEYVERNVPTDAVIAWQSGDKLNIEEGIHFQWHLAARGRSDVRVVAVDTAGKTLRRPELAANLGGGERTWFVSGEPRAKEQAAREFSATYQCGWRRYEVYLNCLSPWP